MSSSYKIALIVVAAVCVLVLTYYIRQDAPQDPAGEVAVVDPVQVVDLPAPPSEPRTVPRDTPPPDRPQQDMDNLMDRVHGHMQQPDAESRPSSQRAPQQDHQATSNPPAPPTWTFDGQTPINVADDLPADDDAANDDDAIDLADQEQNALDQPAGEPAMDGFDVAVNEPATPQTPQPAEPIREQPAPQPQPAAEQPAGVASDQPASSGLRTYTIQPGDTFSSIAVREYGQEAYWVRIAQANPTIDPARLQVGTEIRLPAAGEPAPESAPPAPGQVQTYVVQAGDSLIGIARRFYDDGTLWQVIYNHNRQIIGSEPNRLRSGLRLTIPPRPQDQEE